MNERDRIRLQDMLNQAYKARKFLQGKTQNDLAADEVLTYAVIHVLAIRGEASSKVTKETRDLYPQIAWRNIISMRNRMIHEYNDVDLDIVWEVVHRNLPDLITELEYLMSASL